MHVRLSLATVAALLALGLFAPHPVGIGPTRAEQVNMGEKFSLIDHSGQRVTEADFRGKWMLVFFGFTYCPDVCPATLMTVSHVMEDLGPEAENIQPLFISVDPERDTPEVMAQYVSAFHPKIIGLTGTPEEIRSAANSFGADFQKQEVEGFSDGYIMEHMSWWYLTRPDGSFQGVLLDNGEPEAMIVQLRHALES